MSALNVKRDTVYEMNKNEPIVYAYTVGSFRYDFAFLEADFVLGFGSFCS